MVLLKNGFSVKIQKNVYISSNEKPLSCYATIQKD